MPTACYNTKCLKTRSQIVVVIVDGQVSVIHQKMRRAHRSRAYYLRQFALEKIKYSGDSYRTWINRLSNIVGLLPVNFL